MEIEKKHSYRIILGLILIGLLALIFTLAFFSFIHPELLKTITNINNNNNIIKTQNVCDSSSCLNYVRFIESHIDETVDPCESFYEFSCGKFLKELQLTDDQPGYSPMKNGNNLVTQKVLKAISKPISSNDDRSSIKVKKFYSACINIDNPNNALKSEAYLINVINNELGGWPLLTNAEPSISILELMIRLAYYKQSAFFTLDFGSNPKSARTKIIRFFPPISMIHQEFFKKKEFIESYKSYIKTALAYLNPNYENSDTDIAEMVELNRKLSFIQSDSSDTKNDPPKLISIKKLEIELPKFEWKEFIVKGLFRNANHLNVTEEDSVVINNWAYIAKSLDIYYDYSIKNKRALANYLLFEFFNVNAAYLPTKYQQEALKYKKFLSGTSSLQPTEVYCTELAATKMQMSVGKIFVSEYFDKNSKNKALTMSNNILAQVKSYLNEVDWMDDASKSSVLLKANAIRTQIAYPDNIYNQTYLENLYQVNIEPDNLMMNALKLSNYEFIQDVLKFRLDRDYNEWFFSPSLVNALYDPETNQIYFPAGILQPPFYDSELPNYLNYGSIGSGIGHEIFHGFDDSGRKFDKDGNYFDDGLWTKKSSDMFVNKTKCMIDQYSSYFVKEINKTVDGYLTLGENIADNGGIKQAFKAYKNWIKQNGDDPLLPGVNYTQDQLFFMSFSMSWCSKDKPESLLTQVLTDPHTISQHRINGIMSNTDDFSKAFSCKVGQKHNQPKKCTVW